MSYINLELELEGSRLRLKRERDNIYIYGNLVWHRLGHWAFTGWSSGSRLKFGFEFVLEAMTGTNLGP